MDTETEPDLLAQYNVAKNVIAIQEQIIDALDRPREFAATNISLKNNRAIIGLQRWKKDWMLSFGAQHIDGTKVSCVSGIPKVFDLFLTDEQMQFIVREYNIKGCDQPFVLDELKD